jgi:hypothetical protein
MHSLLGLEMAVFLPPYWRATSMAWKWSQRVYCFNSNGLSLFRRHLGWATAAARELGVDRTQIANAYPDIAREVTRKFQEWRCHNTRLFQSIRHHAYREAAITPAKAGRVPTRNRVMYLLENVSVFSVMDRKACQRICDEVRHEFRIQCR